MLDYNAALTVILYLPDRLKLVAYNDTGHLPPDLRGTGYPREARIRAEGPWGRWDGGRSHGLPSWCVRALSGCR
jgi:hypothetical protein